MPMAQTIRIDLSRERGEQAAFKVLASLCSLADDDRLELEGSGDPGAVCRLVEYAGCRHGEAEPSDGGWKILLWRGPRCLTG